MEEGFEIISRFEVTRGHSSTSQNKGKSSNVSDASSSKNTRRAINKKPMHRKERKIQLLEGKKITENPVFSRLHPR